MSYGRPDYHNWIPRYTRWEKFRLWWRDHGPLLFLIAMVILAFYIADNAGG